MRDILRLSLYTSFFTTLFIGAQAGEFSRSNLKSGDVLLQPLHCWTCSLIEAQENSIYSHIGIYLKIGGEDFVLEAWHEVKLTPLDEYLAKTQKDQKVRVRRFKEIRFSGPEVLVLVDEFAGKTYDSNFLWDNEDEKGEMLYCSELVYKFFYSFYGDSLPIKRMNFNVHREQWIRYFRGTPPDGQWGNSPGDFEKSDLLKDMGEL